ncbi:hypothetical protein Kole_1980 [Kosmotoga olearia TBF 19.5.1]|uniref:Uncharacterized protein n=1 Tax=Kosmotoga olearia (strain ATCC BAA-1733 / DSM 21960 / TBF 19.5.1) TaxID=521045 RepID=C5CH58_KOSOT|nr:hypothetical protein Kole_1980 [Kosmotoga olearia TBF 19.5.1]
MISLDVYFEIQDRLLEAVSTEFSRYNKTYSVQLPRFDGACSAHHPCSTGENRAQIPEKRSKSVLE